MSVVQKDEPQDNVAEESNVSVPSDESKTSEQQESVADQQPEEQATDSQDSGEPSDDAGEPDEGDADSPSDNREPRSVRRLRKENERLKQERIAPTYDPLPVEPPEMPRFEPDREYDENEANQLLQQAKASGVMEADTIVQLRLHQERVNSQNREVVAKAESDLQVSATKLESKYPELNPDSDPSVFRPKLADKLVNDYLKNAPAKEVIVDGQKYYVPTVSLEEYADGWMDVIKDHSTQSAANVSNSIAEAQDSAAIRPGGQGERQDRKFNELSKEEMRAKLGYIDN